MDRIVTPEKLDQMLAKFGAQVLPAMQQAGLAWAFLASRYAIRSMLSGQRLNRVTGTLQRSVAASPESHATGGNVSASFGTNLSYGVAHEQGFESAVAVRAHSRMGHPVRAHSRMVRIRARWYLRDSAEAVAGKGRGLVDKASNYLLNTGEVANAGALMAGGE